MRRERVDVDARSKRFMLMMDESRSWSSKVDNGLIRGGVHRMIKRWKVGRQGRTMLDVVRLVDRNGNVRR